MSDYKKNTRITYYSANTPNVDTLGNVNVTIFKWRRNGLQRVGKIYNLNTEDVQKACCVFLANECNHRLSVDGLSFKSADISLITIL